MPCRGEWHLPSPDTDAFPYLQNNSKALSSHPIRLSYMHCRDAMPRVFSPIGFHLILPIIPVFESGFTGFLGLKGTSVI
jgi:hypothetical protein